MNGGCAWILYELESYTKGRSCLTAIIVATRTHMLRDRVDRSRIVKDGTVQRLLGKPSSRKAANGTAQTASG